MNENDKLHEFNNCVTKITFTWSKQKFLVGVRESERIEKKNRKIIQNKMYNV